MTDKLAEVLRQLLTRMDYIHGDESFQSVWAINQIHAGPYTGPNYAKEFADAKAALTEHDAKEGWISVNGFRELPSDLNREGDQILIELTKSKEHNFTYDKAIAFRRAARPAASQDKEGLRK